MMAFPRNESNYHENPDYVTSWVTHGLLEAHAAGVPNALSMLRRHFDWFNYATDFLAQFLPPYGGDTPGGPWSVDPWQRDHGHGVYLIYQGALNYYVRILIPMKVSSITHDWHPRLLAPNVTSLWCATFIKKPGGSMGLRHEI